MEKIREELFQIANDTDAYHWVQSFLNKYPTEKGFRVECFISPKFMRVSVYK